VAVDTRVGFQVALKADHKGSLCLREKCRRSSRAARSRSSERRARFRATAFRGRSLD
jgi:hypothetical protein